MSCSPYDYLKDKELELWDNTDDCDCDDKDCDQNHKLCSLCLGTVVFSAYIKCQPNSGYNWNIDHIIPTSKFNNFRFVATQRGIDSVDDVNNLQIVHVSCNEIKGNNFNADYKNGYGLIK